VEALWAVPITNCGEIKYHVNMREFKGKVTKLDLAKEKSSPPKKATFRLSGRVQQVHL